MRLAAVCLLVLLARCGPADAPVSHPLPAQEKAAVRSVAPVFDLPALASLTIDEIGTALAPFRTQDTEPTPAEVSAGIVEWAKQFRRDTTTLRVTYDVKTRQVIDFYLSTAQGPTADYGPLLQLGNVPAHDPRWSIEPFAVPGRPGLYLGVRVARE